jgi:hypothetical protein
LLHFMNFMGSCSKFEGAKVVLFFKLIVKLKRFSRIVDK